MEAFEALRNTFPSSVWSAASGIASYIVPKVYNTTPVLPPVPVPSMDVSRMLVRLAGVSGAIAVLAGGNQGTENPEKRQKAFESGSRYHFMHTLALFGTKYARFPITTAVLMASGMLLFCGPCYYFAFTGNTEYNRVARYGGVLLVVAWLSFIL